jgi:hypothetical protein
MPDAHDVNSCQPASWRGPLRHIDIIIFPKEDKKTSNKLITPIHCFIKLHPKWKAQSASRAQRTDCNGLLLLMLFATKDAA